MILAAGLDEQRIIDETGSVVHWVPMPDGSWTGYENWGEVPPEYLPTTEQVPPVMTWTRLAFFNRFTESETDALFNARKVDVKADKILYKLQLAVTVTANDRDVLAARDYLLWLRDQGPEYADLPSAARWAEVLGA